MENINIWTDFITAYQSQADVIKALCIIAPLAFIIIMTALLRPRRTKPDATAKEIKPIETRQAPPTDASSKNPKRWRLQGGVFPHLVEVDEE